MFALLNISFLFDVWFAIATKHVLIFFLLPNRCEFSRLDSVFSFSFSSPQNTWWNRWNLCDSLKSFLSFTQLRVPSFSLHSHSHSFTLDFFLKLNFPLSCSKNVLMIFGNTLFEHDWNNLCLNYDYLIVLLLLFLISATWNFSWASPSTFQVTSSSHFFNLLRVFQLFIGAISLSLFFSTFSHIFLRKYKRIPLSLCCRPILHFRTELRHQPEQTNTHTPATRQTLIFYFHFVISTTGIFSSFFYNFFKQRTSRTWICKIFSFTKTHTHEDILLFLLHLRNHKPFCCCCLTDTDVLLFITPSSFVYIWRRPLFVTWLDYLTFGLFTQLICDQTHTHNQTHRTSTKHIANTEQLLSKQKLTAKILLNIHQAHLPLPLQTVLGSTKKH